MKVVEYVAEESTCKVVGLGAWTKKMCESYYRRSI